MQEDQIVLAFEHACQDDRLIFQVLWQEDVLSIFVNRESSYAANAPCLQALVLRISGGGSWSDVVLVVRFALNWLLLGFIFSVV